jgi:hypothetical protein
MSRRRSACESSPGHERGYLCKTATTADEAKALIEVGFEYVNEI